MNKRFRNRELFLSNNIKLKSLDKYHDIYDYLNLYTIINNNNAELNYIETKTNKLIFKAIGCKPQFLISVYFCNYGKYQSTDIKMAQLINQHVIEKRTHHILLPYTAFITEIDSFVNLIDKNIVNKKDKQYKKIIKNYYNGKYKNIVTILISEYTTEGNLLNFIKKNYRTLPIKTWKILFFQIISVLAIIQSTLPSLLKNDINTNNILLTKITKKKKNRKHMYVINKNKYIIPIIEYQIKLWNFDLSSENDHSYNKYSDLHYFCNTLINEYKHMNMSYIPSEVVEFLTRIVPNKYRTGKYVTSSGHIKNNIKYTTPNKVLTKDCFFDEFKHCNCVKNKIERQRKKLIKKEEILEEEDVPTQYRKCCNIL